MPLAAELLAALLLAQDAYTWQKPQPAVAADPEVERAAAVRFAWSSFDAKAAYRWKAPYRRRFTLWNGEKVTIAFDKPAVDQTGAVSWTGQLEGSKLPAGATLVVTKGVVSAHFQLDDGRAFQLATHGGTVWLQQRKKIEFREARPREIPPIP